MYLAVLMRVLPGMALVALAGCASSRPGLAELVQFLEGALGTKAVLDRKPAQPGEVPLTSADVTHSGKVLGYSPRNPIREGLRKFADWIRGPEGRDLQ